LLGVRWQLTGNMAYRRADEQASRGTELSELRRWAVSGVPAEVIQAFENVNRARLDADQTEGGIKATKQWMVRASADFSVGLGSSREVTDAARAYAELRMAAFDAVYRHNIALAALSKATGTLDSEGRGFYPTREE
jgi:outer membrane protein TolC